MKKLPILAGIAALVAAFAFTGVAYADDTADQITQEVAGTAATQNTIQEAAVDGDFDSFFSMGTEGQYLLEFLDNVAVADGTATADIVIFDRCLVGNGTTFDEQINVEVALSGGSFTQVVDNAPPDNTAATDPPTAFGNNCPVKIDLDAVPSFPKIVDKVQIQDQGTGSNTVAAGFDIVEVQALNSATPVTMDIKFTSDPNAFNCRKKGVNPLTIFGTSSVDVRDIDIDSMELCLADLSSCIGPPRSNKPPHDRGNPAWAGIPFPPDPSLVVTGFETDAGGNQVEVVFNIEGDTTADLRDGILDLDVGFDAQDVATMIGCTNLTRKGGVSEPLVVKGDFTSDGSFISIPVGDTGADNLTRKN